MVNRFWSVFLDLLAPPRESERTVRSLSLEALRELHREDGLPYREQAVTALVWELKYRANTRAAELAGAYLAEELLALASEELGTPLLIPVPMHEERYRERGFNQTELLCEAALAALGGGGTSPRKWSGPRARALKSDAGDTGDPRTFSRGSTAGAVFEYAPDVLVRTRATAPQQGLPKHTRLKNAQNSMAVNTPHLWRVGGRVCVVVDDVTTTGATLKEARRALRRAGARRVHCVALARS